MGNAAANCVEETEPGGVDEMLRRHLVEPSVDVVPEERLVLAGGAARRIEAEDRPGPSRNGNHVSVADRRWTRADGQELTSARLVLRAQAGDCAAFEALYLRHVDQLYAWLRISLRDSHAAEDATQQVFVQAFEALPRFVVRDRPFQAWLFRIARNHVMNLARSRARTDVVPPDTLAEGRETAPWALAAGSAGLDRPKRFGDDLESHVEGLKLAQRQILTLRYMLDLTTAEIATVMDMSTDNVRQIEHRALATLRRRVPGRPAPKVLRRERMLVVLRHAGVLRARRFALAYAPGRAGRAMAGRSW